MNMMHRRAFLAQFLAVATAGATVDETRRPLKGPARRLDGGGLASITLHHGRMEHRRTAPAKRLILTFEGPGCDDLAKRLKGQYPEAFIWKD